MELKGARNSSSGRKAEFDRKEHDVREQDMFHEVSENDHDSEIGARSTRFTFVRICMAIMDKISDIVNSIKIWVQRSIRKIKGTYEDGSFERESVKKWESFYSNFRSKKTQDQLHRVPGKHSTYNVPYPDLVNDLMKSVDTAIHDIQRKDVSNEGDSDYKQAIDGHFRRFVRLLITSIPEEIERRCNNSNPDQPPQIGEGVVIQLAMLVDALRAMHDSPGDAELSVATGLMLMAFVVSNKGSSTEEKLIATNDTLKYLRQAAVYAQSSSTDIANTHDNAMVRDVLNFAILCRDKSVFNMDYTVPDNVMNMLHRKKQIPKNCPKDQVVMAFLLSQMSKSGVFTYDGTNKRVDKEVSELALILSGARVVATDVHNDLILLQHFGKSNKNGFKEAFTLPPAPDSDEM